MQGVKKVEADQTNDEEWTEVKKLFDSLGVHDASHVVGTAFSPFSVYIHSYCST